MPDEGFPSCEPDCEPPCSAMIAMSRSKSADGFAVVPFDPVDDTAGLPVRCASAFAARESMRVRMSETPDVPVGTGGAVFAEIEAVPACTDPAPKVASAFCKSACAAEFTSFADGSADVGVFCRAGVSFADSASKIFPENSLCCPAVAVLLVNVVSRFFSRCSSAAATSLPFVAGGLVPGGASADVSARCKVLRAFESPFSPAARASASDSCFARRSTIAVIGVPLCNKPAICESRSSSPERSDSF